MNNQNTKWVQLKPEVCSVVDGNGFSTVTYTTGEIRVIPYAQYLYEHTVDRELLKHEDVIQIDGNRGNYLIENLRLIVRHPDYPSVIIEPLTAYVETKSIKRKHIYLDKRHNRKFIEIHYDNGKRFRTPYARYFLQQHLKRTLFSFEETDHIDNDCSNDSIYNLQILSRKKNAEKAAIVRGYRTGSEVTGKYHCHRCSKEFSMLNRNLGKQKLLFCSRYCNAKWYRDEKYPNGAPTIELNCSQCNVLFSKVKSKYERQLRNGVTDFFCSPSCLSKHNVRQMYPDTLSKKEITCHTCGSKVMRNNNAKFKRKLASGKPMFCSRSCVAVNSHREGRHKR